MLTARPGLRVGSLHARAARAGSLCLPSRNVARTALPARQALRVVAAAAPPSKPSPASAKEGVEAGLAAFSERRDYEEAVRLFKASLELNPSSQEAAAALFNLGCAYAKQRKFKQAADAIGRAINEHDLKLSVALKVRWRGCSCDGRSCRAACGACDAGRHSASSCCCCCCCQQDDDLRELRDSREWLDMLATAKGGLSREQKVGLRAEAKVGCRRAVYKCHAMGLEVA